MQKYIALIIVVLLGFTACSDNWTYRIEGKIANLEEPTIYVIFESESEKLIDTLTCELEGKFEIIQKTGDYHTATLLMNDKTQWATVFLAPGKRVKVNGDVRYVSLFQIKGGSDINGKLSDFRSASSNLWKEQADLIAKLEKKKIDPIEEADLMSKLTNVNHQLEEQAILQIKKHPDEAASLALIQYFFTNPDDTREVDELLALISPKLREHFIYKALEEYSVRAKRTSIGAEAPSFKVKNLLGKEIDLSKIPDKYILLAFTGPWGGMNHAEDPYLSQIAATYPVEELELIVITLDEYADKLRARIKKDTISWNLVTDSAGQASALIDLYNVSELPSCYLIDKDKKILLKTENNVEIRDTLEELLGEKQ